MAAYTRRHAGSVVIGTGWDEMRWRERRAPTAAELDRAADGRRVYLSRIDGHSAVASSALLADAPDAHGQVGFVGNGMLFEIAEDSISDLVRDWVLHVAFNS